MPRAGKSESRASGKSRSVGKNNDELLREIEALRARLEEAEATVQAIQTGGVDALIVSGPDGEKVFALEGADYPYRVIVDVMNEGVVTLGADGGILSCNTRFANFVQMPTEQILGKPLARFTTTEDAPKLRAFLKEAAPKGGVVTTTMALVDGSTKQVNLSAGAFEVGGLPALCIVVTDMTEIFAATETRLRLASIVETSNDAIISTSLDNIILTWNAAAERIYGFSDREAVGQPLSLIVPRDRIQEVEMINGKIRLGQSLEGYETLRITKSGAPIHVSLTVSPLMDPNGNVTGISVIARDITARKKDEAELEKYRQQLEEMVQQRTHELLARTDELHTANEELQTQRKEMGIANEELEVQAEELRRAQVELDTARARYFSLYDLAPVGYCTLSEKGLILEANLTAATLLGARRSALVEQPITRFILKEDQDTYYHYRKKLSKTDEPQTCELRMMNKNGMGFRAHLVATAAQDDDGARTYRVVLSDITERKRTEEALRQVHAEASNERLRLETVMEVLPTGVAITDAVGGSIQSNKEFERIWAGPHPAIRAIEDYAVFKAWWTDTGKPVAPEEWASFQAMRQGRVVAEQMLEIQRFDGSRAFVINSAAPVRDAAGIIIGSAVAIQEITDLRNAELRIQELNNVLQEQVATVDAMNKELESYSHSVSHDLRTPLRFVNRIAHLLLNEPGEHLSNGAIQQVNMILQATSEMAVLIENLLVFSQVSREPIRKRRLDLRRLFQEAVKELQHEQEDRDVEIAMQDLAPCQGDRTLLKEVVTNLLANALKFTRRREKALITVGCTETGTETVYFVQDNGVGFDMSNSDAMFVPFQRLHKNADFEGTGIGLALVKRIVERHGGRVWAVGEVDKGATFHFTLPKETAE